MSKHTHTWTLKKPAPASVRRILILAGLSIIASGAGAGDGADDLAAEISQQGEQALAAMHQDIQRRVADRGAWLGRLCSMLAAATASSDAVAFTGAPTAAPAAERCPTPLGNTTIAKPVDRLGIKLESTAGAVHP